MPTPKDTLTRHNGQDALQWLLRYSPEVVLQSPVLRPSPYESIAEQAEDVTLVGARTTLYTMTQLNAFQTHELLTNPLGLLWTLRKIGGLQKTLYRERLLKRVGHAPSGSTAPAFKFNSADWQNIFQLEALVEFYMNFNDPWLPGPPLTEGVNLPRPPWHPPMLDNGYVTVDLRSGWHLVLVDSFGGRISGTAATANGKVVTLDGLPVPSKVNPNFDTIYLPGDTARPSKTYRITAVDDALHTVTLDDKPMLSDESSPWHIPAGVSGQLPPMTYVLGPGGADGFDHFDGAMFIVKDGVVHGQYRWNSYTSRYNPNDPEYLSSLRGNRGYDFTSFMSPLPTQKSGQSNEKYQKTVRGAAFRNYNFKVTDPGEKDHVLEARFYFDTPVTRDANGKTNIRIHNSTKTAPTKGCNSAGCIVSSNFYTFRDKMIDLYQAGYQATHGGTEDAAIRPLRGADRDTSPAIWRKSVGLASSASDTITANQWRDCIEANQWRDCIRGTFWLVRPDERPEG